MVERRYTKEQGIIHRARCPYLSNLRILETTTTREGDMLIFDIRAGVLAKAHNYQFRLASNTWSQIRRNGIVSRIPQWKIDKFEAALEEQCLTGQAQLNMHEVTLPDDKGVIRVTEAVTDLVNGKGRRMTDFYKRPCRFCGRRDHSLLKNRGNQQRDIIEAMCPYIRNPQISNAIPATNGELLVYEIRAITLAKQFKYNHVAALNFMREVMNENPLVSLHKRWEIFSDYLRDLCRKIRGESVWKELRSAPCQGCGSPSHGYLQRDCTTGKHRYSCPCMDREEGHQVEWYEERRSGYQLCPLRLAREYKYNEQKTHMALDAYTKKGVGRFKKNQEALRLLRDRAILACRIWNDPTLDWITNRQKETIKTEEPIADTHDQAEPSKLVTGESVQIRNQQMILIAVGILVALSSIFIRPQTISSTTEVIPYNDTWRIREPLLEG
jgi:hypothetical protein